MYRAVKFKGIHFIILAVLGAMLILVIKNAVGNIGKDNNGESPEAVMSFLSGYGWEVGDYTTKNVQIPAKFSDVYKVYNELQKIQGFDLSKYRTENALSYTFTVLNHPSGDNVYANVLVIGDKIVGGDICSYALDGFMTGFDGNTIYQQ